MAEGLDIGQQGAVENNWHFYWYHLFRDYYLELLEQVETLAQKDPDGFHKHKLFKLLTSIDDALRLRVAQDPEHTDFRLGNTLGNNNRHWRRVKNGLPNRYRMFFQFDKVPQKNVVVAWINDENTLRKAGSSSDVYEVFKKLLKQKKVPSSMEELLQEIGVA